MGLVDRFSAQVKQLFARAQVEDAPPPLSTSVVTHDGIDEGVLEEFRERSTRFNSVFDQVPEVETAPAEYDENGNLTADATTELYEPAPDLYSDVFHSLHTYSEPEVRPSEEVLPSHELHRQVMQQFIHADGFNELRAYTRHDDVSAALATMEALDTINEHLTTTLREHAERAKQMQDAQDQMEGLAGDSAGIHGQVQAQGGQATQEQKDKLRENAQARYDARQRLEQLAQEQQQAPIGMAAQEAVNEAIDNAQRTTEAFNTLPGSQAGTHGMDLSPEEALAFAETIKNNPQIQRVLELLGRMERDMRFKRTNRIVGGHEEPIDITQGADLSLTLPTELAKINHPLLRLDFMRRYFEHGVLMHEMIGYAEAGKGPVVVCLDVSGSMGAGKLAWARATALSTISIAHREKRHAAAVDFDTRITGTWEFPHHQPISTGMVVEYAATGASGGTDITVALRKALEICDTQPNFKKADVLLITDGEDTFGQDDIELRSIFEQKGIRVHGVGIAIKRSTYLDEMCESWTPVEDLAGPSQATTHIAQAIT